MASALYQSKKGKRRTNLTEEELAELERQWDLDGKSSQRKRWLRYYYRNRTKFLVKRREVKEKEARVVRGTRRTYDEDYVEKVPALPKLIA